MINEEEFGRFESKYLKIPVGGQQFITVTNWVFQMVTYADQAPKPKICMDVIGIEGKPATKLFFTGNRDLILQQLKPIFISAQAEGKTVLDLLLTRGGQHDYRVSVIRAAVRPQSAGGR